MLRNKGIMRLEGHWNERSLKLLVQCRVICRKQVCYRVVIPPPFHQVMWRCQLCLYSLCCWKRPPENVVFQTASSINIKSKEKIKRRDWWGWFGFGNGNGCFWAGITQLAPSGHMSRGEQVVTGSKCLFCRIMCFWSPCYSHGSPLAFLL